MYQRCQHKLSGPKISHVVSRKKHLTAIKFKELLVQDMETNDLDTSSRHLQRGANAIQGLISSSKRKRNKVPITPLGLQRINEMDSSSDEDTGAHCRHTIQRRHRTQWKLWNCREKRGPRVNARHWTSHLFENRNPLRISFLRRKQICSFSLHQLL